MPVPDFARSRRQLRRARIQDALSMPREGVNLRLERDRLLERLAVIAGADARGFDELDEGTIETVVSVAVAEVDEAPADSLFVALLSSLILAQDGQFARLSLMGQRLSGLARRLEGERPYLALAVDSFAMSVQGREVGALEQLQARLSGNTPVRDTPISMNRDHLDDLLSAAAMRSALRNNTEFADRARRAALAVGSGLALAFVDAAEAWRASVEMARPQHVLQSSDEVFGRPELRDYLARRDVGVLYPAQIRAIEAGATLDRDCVVSLPTSSGKTLLAEFRIAATLTRHPGDRAIYVAPYRMLSRQVERTIGDGLRPLGLVTLDFGSGFDTDFSPDSVSNLPDVGVCTPERLDALLRISSEEDEAGQRALRLFETTRVLVLGGRDCW